jgi:hypothetical protein
MILSLEFYNGDRDSLVEIEVDVMAHRERDGMGGYDDIIEGFEVLSVTESLSNGDILDLGTKVPSWISYDDVITEIQFADWEDA